MSKAITVLKFGGSVLRDEGDLTHVVHEVYRHWRQGSQVLVVVSAFNGTTDELLQRSRAFSTDPNPQAVASLLLTGETTCASLLSLALERSGIPAMLRSAHQIGLTTDGDPLDAEPVSVNTERLRNELKNSVVVVSGFGGIDTEGNSTLLGRGGSDFTALFLAERLDARCVLIKDVKGLYNGDPNAAASDARRFETAGYATAIEFGGPLIQEKSVRFAERNALTIELSQLGSDEGTRIGDLSDKLVEEAADKRRPIRVALLGCGVVGGGVFERLSAMPEEFEIVGVTNLHPAKARAAGVPERLIVPDADRLIDGRADVVVECVGGVETAARFIQRALANGKHVVSANKALIAHKGLKFSGLAHRKGVTIRNSAAVGGVMPALEYASNLRSLGVLSLAGIVNGTCNFICDQLASGIEFDDAVKAAQAAGFAEADPTLDINGTDAAQKLILLTREAFGVDITFESIDRQGIENLTVRDLEDALQRGFTFRLVAQCTITEAGIAASVRPVELPLDHPFAQIHGADNCLVIETADGKTTISGRGAGRYATTEAVIADLFDVRRQIETRKERVIRAGVNI